MRVDDSTVQKLKRARAYKLYDCWIYSALGRVMFLTPKPLDREWVTIM